MFCGGYAFHAEVPWRFDDASHPQFSAHTDANTQRKNVVGSLRCLLAGDATRPSLAGGSCKRIPPRSPLGWTRVPSALVACRPRNTHTLFALGRRAYLHHVTGNRDARHRRVYSYLEHCQEVVADGLSTVVPTLAFTFHPFCETLQRYRR